MKKTIFMIFIVLLVIVIFLFTNDEKVYYLAFGDEKKDRIIIDELKEYFNENLLYENDIKYIKENYRTTDLINDINDNIKLKEKTTLKNALIKADVITIKIGKNDYINYINDIETLDINLLKLKNDMEELFKIIRNISKEKIIFLGIYNPYPKNKELDEILKKLNEMYSKLSDEYNIYYLDIYGILDKYINEGYLDIEGYKYIASKLIKEIDNDIIK